ncbi:unnamed protein product [Parascedosporium putredinis]|uniref:Uncharacterized protein n=1 Tax=Parascedosporium putredinis TaxID=1442378 RepID=A0A9P1MA94_9PEZI|nr:unnamed protein product [Parascedosporium putredinis]CAI7996194.1 unnamed protein product [Parascedosporium putredinis]
MPRDSPPLQLAGDAPREHVPEMTTSETTTTNVTTESKATPTKYEPESEREITPRDCQLPKPAETAEVDSKQDLPTTSTTQDSSQPNAEPATFSGSSSFSTTPAMKDSPSPEPSAKERSPSTSGSGTVKRTPSPSASLLTDSSFSTSKTTSSSGSSNGTIYGRVDRPLARFWLGKQEIAIHPKQRILRFFAETERYVFCRRSRNGPEQQPRE